VIEEQKITAELYILTEKPQGIDTKIKAVAALVAGVRESTLIKSVYCEFRHSHYDIC